jgi:signal transduction histidine kinase
MDSYGIWLVMKEFDVIDLVKSALNTFEGKCEERNISLILNNHCENTTVLADKTKIQQVIYNLLDNAIKFTPNDKNIYVTLSEKNDKLFISVKDEGCGIPADSINKIWVRFYKADASRGKDKQGTGLGLAITREIVKAHGENINVVSTEGVGSEFTFSLTKSKDNSNTEQI